MAAAVQSAVNAQSAWAAVNPQRRARVLFNFKALVEADADNLARLLSEEHGKVIADSQGDIQRGLGGGHLGVRAKTLGLELLRGTVLDPPLIQ